MKTSIIKLRSKACLLGNILVLSLLFFIFSLIFLCLNLLPEIMLQLFPFFQKGIGMILFCVTIIFLSFSLFILSDMGFTRFFLKKAQKKEVGIKDIFFYLFPKNALKLLTFALKFSLMKAALLLMCFLPFAINFLAFFTLFKNTLSLKVSLVMLITALLFFLSGTYFYSLFGCSLFLVKYYYIKGEQLDFRGLVSLSQLQMKKHRASLMKLKLSFSLWLMLSLLLFPWVYVFSYYSQSKAVAANEFMAD